MKKIFKLITLAFLSASMAQAGVNLKNGNFYVSYTDIVVPGGGKPLELTRTYNSKSTYAGWFGFGWGTDYETYLTVGADGSVIIHESGSGATTRFTPKTEVDAKGAAQKIIDAMMKTSQVSEKNAKELLERLSKDAELRQMYARRHGIKSSIADGTILYSNNRGIQRVKKVKSGYQREFSDGKVEFFNDGGKLTKINFPDKTFTTFEYDSKNTRLTSIKDSYGKQIFFEWYADGKVQHIWSAGDKKAEFKFREDNLIYSKDLAGNVYQYDYDNNHNLTKITYDDKTFAEIRYEPKTFFVSQFTSRDGEVTKYKYDSNPKNPNYHYWTEVSKKNAAGKWYTNRFEYEIKAKPDGELYTYRNLTIIDGLKTETIYTECCGLPQKITRGSHVTNFEYNSQGLLTKKTSSTGEHVELTYHPKMNKIVKVVNNQGTTKFDYDDKTGNLVRAENGSQIVRLVYDLSGRIVKMLDRDNKTKASRQLEFTYNSLGRPSVIALEGGGKINVSYDNYGQVLKADSPQGQKVAMDVSQAFQSLIEIVRPAGVSLSL